MYYYLDDHTKIKLSDESDLENIVDILVDMYLGIVGTSKDEILDELEINGYEIEYEE